MTWLIRGLIFCALSVFGFFFVPHVQAQRCPPAIEVESYREAGLSEAQRQQLGAAIQREYQAVCRSQSGTARLKKFTVFPDEIAVVPLPGGGSARVDQGQAIKFYPIAGHPEGGFIAIKRSAAAGLLSGSNPQLLRSEISRSFAVGTPATTGGDEDVEEGAPVDGGGAAPPAAGAGCVGQPGRLIPSSPENCTVGDIVALITNGILPFFLNIAGGIAIIMILWGAFQYFTAYGDPQKIDAGKKTLTWAIIGLVVIIAARAIITYSCEFFAADRNICNVNIQESS